MTDYIASDLPELPKWDEEGSTIDLPLVDQIIDEVLVNWGIEVQDYSDPEWPQQVANGIGPGEAVEYEELYSLMRDIAQAALNTAQKGA